MIIIELLKILYSTKFRVLNNLKDNLCFIEGQSMVPIDLLFIFCIKLYLMIKYDKIKYAHNIRL